MHYTDSPNKNKGKHKNTHLSICQPPGKEELPSGAQSSPSRQTAEQTDGDLTSTFCGQPGGATTAAAAVATVLHD